MFDNKEIVEPGAGDGLGKAVPLFERQYLTDSFYFYHSFSVIVAQPLSFALYDRGDIPGNHDFETWALYCLITSDTKKEALKNWWNLCDENRITSAMYSDGEKRCVCMIGSQFCGKFDNGKCVA